MKKVMQALASYSWGVLMFAVLLGCAGFCLIAFPDDALPTVILVIAIAAIVFAIVRAAMVLAEKERGFPFFFKMLSAALALFAAIFLLVRRDSADEILSFFVGAMVVIDGSFKLHTAIMSRRYRMVSWWIMLAVSVLTIIGALWLIKSPPEGMRVASVFMGLLLMVDALQNLLSTAFNPSIERRIRKEILAENAQSTALTESAAPADNQPKDK